MEEQNLPETETDVAELELEAVIGFNGEAWSIHNTPGTSETLTWWHLRGRGDSGKSLARHHPR